MNITTRFTEESVLLAESYCDDANEPAALKGGSRFADYAMISPHGLRISLKKHLDEQSGQQTISEKSDTKDIDADPDRVSDDHSSSH